MKENYHSASDEVGNVEKWTEANRMSLNLTKTWEITVSGKSANPPPEPIVGVERKTWLKLLGMIHLVGTLIMLIISHLELVVVCTL